MANVLPKYELLFNDLKKLSIGTFMTSRAFVAYMTSIRLYENWKAVYKSMEEARRYFALEIDHAIGDSESTLAYYINSIPNHASAETLITGIIVKFIDTRTLETAFEDLIESCQLSKFSPINIEAIKTAITQHKVKYGKQKKLVMKRIKIPRALANPTNSPNEISERDLSYFTDKKNIPNQELVKETIEYFQTGEGKRAFSPLELLILLESQLQFIKQNCNDADKVVQELQRISLTEEQRHILYGFILKWTGGYPVNNLDEEFNRTLKLIQREFLAFPVETPEKIFCKADRGMQRKFMKLSIVLNNSLSSNQDANELWLALEEPRQSRDCFSSFKELFETAIQMESIKTSEHILSNEALKSYHNFCFNVWLQDYRNWEYGDEEQYRLLLTKANWRQYLLHELQLEGERKQRYETEKASWQIPSTRNHQQPEEDKSLLNIKYKQEQELKILSVISKGENKYCEFKSSLRLDLRKGTVEKYIEHTAFKNIAAFLNSDGGTLIIGVDDEKNVVGLEATDYTTFSRPDKQDEWSKHLDNLIQNHVGNKFHTLINTGFIQLEDKTVAIIEVNASREPVWLQNNDKQEFYVRRTASAIQLTPKETAEYIKEHWR
jgi:hypothetical protein